MDIILTQYIVLRPRHNVDVSQDTVSSMFVQLPLALHACIDTFGYAVLHFDMRSVQILYSQSHQLGRFARLYRILLTTLHGIPERWILLWNQL